jgi:hypothetical protein
LPSVSPFPNADGSANPHRNRRARRPGPFVNRCRFARSRDSNVPAWQPTTPAFACCMP